AIRHAAPLVSAIGAAQVIAAIIDLIPPAVFAAVDALAFAPAIIAAVIVAVLLAVLTVAITVVVAAPGIGGCKLVRAEKKRQSQRAGENAFHLMFLSFPRPSNFKRRTLAATGLICGMNSTDASEDMQQTYRKCPASGGVSYFDTSLYGTS